MDFDDFKEFMGELKDKIAERLEQVNFGSGKAINYLVKLGETKNLPWEYNDGKIVFSEGLTDIYGLIPLTAKIKAEIAKKGAIEEMKKEPEEIAEIEKDRQVFKKVEHQALELITDDFRKRSQI